MTSKNYSGVYQLNNGYWGYRYAVYTNGKKKDVKKTKDENGNPFKTEKAAFRARETALVRERELNGSKKPKKRVTVKDVFKEYCENGRSGKAYATIRKQDSLWNNYICDKFGSRFIDDISVAEINDYLTHLYYVEGRAYGYVQSFLKMFYLIFGQAYSRNYLDLETYNKLCVAKDVRICMPKMKVDEETDIVVYDKEQINRLEKYFTGTNAETAFLLGCYCGLRINECYGLKWENVDVENGTITIDRQMQCQNGIIKLVSLKTRNSRRTVYMNAKLKEYFILLKKQREKDKSLYKEQREQRQTFLTDLDGNTISSLDLVNSLGNGKIQTINTMNYHSKRIREKLQIDFKYHNLRHTYGTRLAEMNTPTHILCNQMGHASGRVTEMYYLGVSKNGLDVLKKNLDKMEKFYKNEENEK